MKHFAPILLTFPLLLLPLASTTARADSYQLTTIAASQSATFYGIDDLQNFTVQYSGRSTCGGAATTSGLCYQTLYTGSGAEVFSTLPPPLHWDNGASCLPALPGLSVASGLCNGSHFLAAGTYPLPGNDFLRGVWAGPNPNLFTDLISTGSIDGGLMNALGDAVYIDGINNTLVFAQDLSTTNLTAVTPEPSSLLLLAMGILASARTFRRHRTV